MSRASLIKELTDMGVRMGRDQCMKPIQSLMVLRDHHATVRALQEDDTSHQNNWKPSDQDTPDHPPDRPHADLRRGESGPNGC